MKTICVIGAGQLGSRHLQALKNVSKALRVYVIDPFEQSLKVAKERYDVIEEVDTNELSYHTSLSEIDSNTTFDIAIVATTSNVRKAPTVELVENFNVDIIVFEKLLFQRKEDYHQVLDLLKKHNVKAYVNCCMRMMSFYNKIKSDFQNTKFKYTVSGSQYGLVTNLIHYIDHMCYLNNSTDYVGNSKYLDTEIIESKRKGFYELTGNYQVQFQNGTQGDFTCYPEGDSPAIIQIFNEKTHIISKEAEGIVWVSKFENNWSWEEIEFNIPYQSQLTTILIDGILEGKGCPLPLYEESMKIHLPLLGSLLDFVNDNCKINFDYYPFT